MNFLKSFFVLFNTEYTDKQLRYARMWNEIASKAVKEQAHFLQASRRVNDEDSLMYFLRLAQKYGHIARYCITRWQMALDGNL